MHSIDELRDIFLQHLQNARFTSEPKNLYEPNNYFLNPALFHHLLFWIFKSFPLIDIDRFF